MIRIEYAPGRTRGEGRLSEALVRRVAHVVSDAVHLKETYTISVALVDGPTIRRLNKTFRGKDTVTDVLAFEYDETDVVGEVLICSSRAREQAGEVGRPLRDEMIELLVHGLLHVLGYDHITTRDARRMLPLQERIVKQLV